MKKNSKKHDETENTDKEIIIAKIGYKNTIIVAILGLIGTALTAYLGYLSNRPINQTTIESTQTEAFLAPPSTSTLDTIPIEPTATLFTVPSTPTPSIPQIEQGSISPALASDPNSLAIVYPSCNCYESKLVSFPFTIRLRWGGKTAAIAENGANLVSYSLKIDGVQVVDIDQYRKPAIFAQDPVLPSDDPAMWWVYWDYPVTNRDDSKFDFFIQADLITLDSIDTGWDVISGNTIVNFELRIKISPILFITALPLIGP
jgi:hypothetical protein